MSIRPPNISLFSKYCPCDFKKMTINQSCLISVVGIAIAIAGVAGMIFTQSIGGAIGFGLYGCSIFYNEWFKDNREYVDLTTQLKNSEQSLTNKQKEIVNLMTRLSSLEITSLKNQAQLKKQIKELQALNDSWKHTLEKQHREQETLERNNQSLITLNKTSTLQNAELKKSGETLGRRIQNFLEQNKQFIPQIDQLSAISTQLQGSEQNFRDSIERDLQTFTMGLQTLKSETTSMIAENKILGAEIAHLKSVLDKGGQASQQLVAESERFLQDSTAIREETKRLTTLKDELSSLLTQISLDQAALNEVVQFIKNQREEIGK